MFPLLDRFPALRALPRATLGSFPSPVECLPGSSVRPPVWLKREDLNVEPPHLGGNKVRALEFLLGDICPGDVVVTLGGEGSTHVLATALHAARRGARTVALQWPHEMNPSAQLVAEAAAGHCGRIVRTPGSLTAWLATVAALPLSRYCGVRVIPMGGSTPIGTLGHVNAALELAAQVEAGLLPPPTRIVVPLGTGGTAAGLLLGLAIAGLPTQIVAARIAPRLGAPRWRVLRLARSTARLIERRTGKRIARVVPERFAIDHSVYGGAFGRAFPGGEALARDIAAEHGLKLDGTYGTRGIVAAIAAAGDPNGETLYWVTFDMRALPTVCSLAVP
jgi:D-cysteine desulfhydrase